MIPPSESKLPRFSAVIFDLGSTLIYFDAPWDQVIAEADEHLVDMLIASGLPLQREAFLDDFRWEIGEYFAQRDTEFIEYTTYQVLRNLLARWGVVSVQESLLRRALADMYRITQRHWKLEEDAHPTLQALQAAGYRLGMISNTADDANVQQLIDNGRLRPYFDFILTSAGQGIRKPNPRIFHQALAHWTFPPERVAMVGDMLGADVLGARNAGLFSVWITRRADVAANHAHEDTIRPDATIAALSDLSALLDGEI